MGSDGFADLRSLLLLRRRHLSQAVGRLCIFSRVSLLSVWRIGNRNNCRVSQVPYMAAKFCVPKNAKKLFKFLSPIYNRLVSLHGPEYWKITNIMISDQIKIIWSKSDLRSDQISFCKSDLIWSDLIWSVIFRSFSDHF